MPGDEITRDTPLDPTLDHWPACDVLGVLVLTLAGFEGAGDRPLIETTRHALTSAFGDLRLLVDAIEGGTTVSRATAPAPLAAERLETTASRRSMAAELYWRIVDGWDGVDVTVQRAVLDELRMLQTDGSRLDPDDLLGLLDEIDSLDHDQGDGDRLVGATDALARRFERAGGRPESLLRPVVLPPLAPRVQAPNRSIRHGIAEAGRPAMKGRVVDPHEAEARPSGDPRLIELIEALLDELIAQELLVLRPEGSTAELAPRFVQACERGEVSSLTELDDWLVEQDDVDEIFFDEAQLVALARAVGSR